MGETLYDEVVREDTLDRPCRVYAPVGTHETLLAYLVRRLLENGANSSFVNRLVDPAVSVDELVTDQVAMAERHGGAPHGRIPLPRDLYRPERPNSQGIDLASEHDLRWLDDGLAARPLDRRPHPRRPPLRARQRRSRSAIPPTTPTRSAPCARPPATRSQTPWPPPTRPPAGWAATEVDASARPASSAPPTCMEARAARADGLAVREAGKTLPNAHGRGPRSGRLLPLLRGAQSAAEFDNRTHKGARPGRLHRPWNFPLAIFTGEVAAALAAGNPVLAKPAEQTPLIAAAAVRLFHRAGVPADVLQLLPGNGATVGAALTADPRVAGRGVHRLDRGGAPDQPQARRARRRPGP